MSTSTTNYLRDGIWRIDLALARRYALGKAYRISLQERPRDLPGGGVAYTYGETPLSPLRRILELTEAGPDDTFLELGCGTGRFSLVASRWLGLKARGVDRIPTFVQRAQAIAQDQGLHNCSFVDADLFDVPWSDASILYLTATTFSPQLVERINDKCSQLSPGARLVTLTHPPQAAGLHQQAMEVLDFSWGPATVFVHQVHTA